MFVAIHEANAGSKLSIFTKNMSMSPRYDFRDNPWRHAVIEDFAGDVGASISDVLCDDFDGDGVDEIVVSISSRGPQEIILSPRISLTLRN